MWSTLCLVGLWGGVPCVDRFLEWCTLCLIGFLGGVPCVWYVCGVDNLNFGRFVG